MALLRIFFLLITGLLSFVPSQLRADDTIYTSVDINPVPVRTPPPEYPSEMKRAGVVGVVAITIVIDEKGTVASANVAKSTDSGFNAAALAAIKKWTFKPGKKDGVPVKTKVTIPLRFDLDD
ncbi:MAG: energy transducer TonB [Nibricoccus sp.]